MVIHINLLLPSVLLFLSPPIVCTATFATTAYFCSKRTIISTSDIAAMSSQSNMLTHSHTHQANGSLPPPPLSHTHIQTDNVTDKVTCIFFCSTDDVVTVFNADKVFVDEIVDVGAEKVTCDDPFRQSRLVIGWRPAPWSHLSLLRGLLLWLLLLWLLLGRLLWEGGWC